MKKNIVIVLLVIAVLGLGGFVVYDKMLKKDESKEIKKDNGTQNKSTSENISKIDETKDYYYYETTDEIGEILGFRSDDDEKEVFEGVSDFEQWKLQNKDFKIPDEEYGIKNNKIRLKYPIINIDSADVKNINSKIKQMIYEKEIKNTPVLEDEIIIAVKNSSNEIASLESVYWNDFKIFENDKYISVIVYETGLIIHGGTYYELNDVFVVDKVTGKQLTSTDIFEKYGLSIKDVEKSIEKVYVAAQNSDDRIELENDENFSVGINEGKYKLYIDEKEKLNLISSGVTSSADIEYFKYENNQWEYMNM